MNPLRGIPNPRTVLAWGSFDLANQSFALIINTLLFGIFVSEVVMEGNQGGDFAWSLMGSLSLGVVAVIGPVLGALADARSAKKKVLVSTGLACATLTTALCLLPTASEVGIAVALALAFLVYVPANMAFNIGENFLASFLPEIASREMMGRVSSIGWTMGYFGALVLLGILVIPTKFLGVTEPSQWRPLFAFAGIWFAVMMIPTFLFLPEKKKPQPKEAQHPVRQSFAQLRTTAREVSVYRDLAWLLGSFFIYGMGMQVIIFFAGKIARDDFGFETGYLVVFTGVVTVFAGLSAFTTGQWQDRIGHKTTLLLSLGFWTLVAGALATTSHLRSQSLDVAAFPSWPLWSVGIGIGIGLGGLGTATRAAVGVLTPSHRTAEFFGLWGTTSKLAGVIGLPIFGAIRSQAGSVPSLIILAGFFLAGGLIAARCVNMRRGSEGAAAIEKQHRDEVNLMDVATTAGAEPLGTSALTAQLPDDEDLDRVRRAEREGRNPE